jgi:hypothetical protein
MIQNRRWLVGWLGMAIFVFGLTAATIYQSITSWGEIEATMFNPGMPVDDQLDTLRCPLIITSNEVATVRATFENPTDRNRIRIVRASISEGFVTLRREITTNLPLEPGEVQTLEWEISAADAAWGRYVFVRVFTPRSGPMLPTQTKACGILVVNWPWLKGSHIANTLFILGLLGPILGLGIWSGVYWPFSDEQRQKAYLMGILTVVVMTGLYLSMIGQWIPHLLLLIILFFMLVSLATRVLMAIGEPST